MQPRCPICRQPTKPATENPTAPFCSSRCRTIDLGNWLTEHYRVPVSEPDEILADPGDEPAAPRTSTPGPWRN